MLLAPELSCTLTIGTLMDVRLLARGDGAAIHVVGDAAWKTVRGWIRRGGEDAKELKRRVERVANQGTKPGGFYNPQHIHDTGVRGVRAIKMGSSGIRLPYVQMGDDIYVIHALKKKRDAYSRADRETIGDRYAEFQAYVEQLDAARHR